MKFFPSRAMNTISLDDTEYADLARLAKVEFRIFCQNHKLPFHFPDAQKLDVKKDTDQFPLFLKALKIFNKANANRIFIVNGKPVTFLYSFGGLDLEYLAYDPKMLLRTYLDLEAERVLIKKREAWVAAALLVLITYALLNYGGWAWLAFAFISVTGYLLFLESVVNFSCGLVDVAFEFARSLLTATDQRKHCQRSQHFQTVFYLHASHYTGVH